MFRIWKFRKLIGENPEPAKKIISWWPASCRRPWARQPWICGTSPGCTPRQAAAAFRSHETLLIQWFLRSTRVCLKIGYPKMSGHEFPLLNTIENLGKLIYCGSGSGPHQTPIEPRGGNREMPLVSWQESARVANWQEIALSCPASGSPWSSTKGTKHLPQWFACDNARLLGKSVKFQAFDIFWPLDSHPLIVFGISWIIWNKPAPFAAYRIPIHRWLIYNLQWPLMFSQE